MCGSILNVIKVNKVKEAWSKIFKKKKKKYLNFIQKNSLKLYANFHDLNFISFRENKKL